MARGAVLIAEVQREAVDPVHRRALHRGGQAVHIGTEAHIAVSGRIGLEVVEHVADGEPLYPNRRPPHRKVRLVLRVYERVIEEELVEDRCAAHGDHGIRSFGVGDQGTEVPQVRRPRVRHVRRGNGVPVAHGVPGGRHIGRADGDLCGGGDTKENRDHEKRTGNVLHGAKLPRDDVFLISPVHRSDQIPFELIKY